MGAQTRESPRRATRQTRQIGCRYGCYQKYQFTQVIPASAPPQRLPRKTAIEKHQSSQGLGSTPASSSSNQPSLIRDDAIDPALLALSVQLGSDDNFSMSQAVSPVPSSSFSSTGPMTPTSLAWDPDTFTSMCVSS